MAKTTKKMAVKLERQSVLPNVLYKRRGRKHRPKLGNSQHSKKAMQAGAKMAQIEKYAKDNNVTVAQAMVHFME